MIEPEATPIFILGKPRSGATFIWSYLSGFPDTLPFVRGSFLKEPIFAEDGKFCTSESGVFVEDFQRGCAIFQGALRLCATAHLIEKTPAHAPLAGQLGEAFPTARFIYVFRPKDERWKSFRRAWPDKAKDDFLALDWATSPDPEAFARLDDQGRILVVEYRQMKTIFMLSAVVAFAFGQAPEDGEMEKAFAYAESRPVALPVKR